MGRPEKPEDLKNHKFVKHTGVTLKDSFPLRVGDGTVNIEFKPIVSTNSSLQVAHFAAAGIGLAIIPEYIVNDDSLKNDLEMVLPNYPIDIDVYFYAVYSTRRYLSPKVRTLIDFMVEWFKKK